MIFLPQVALVALTSKDIPRHQKALDYSKMGIQFGKVMLIQDSRIKNIDDWNKTIVYELGDLIHSQVPEVTHIILIHADGYIVNPELWNPEWLNYDYIGAPWPLPVDNYSYRDVNGTIQRVGNSVSLRSVKLMQLPKQLGLEWKSYYGNTNEDGFICVHNRHIFEAAGCKFAPLEVAVHFSKEHEIPENKGLETFAFHSL